MSDVLIAGKQDVESSCFGCIEKLAIFEPRRPVHFGDRPDLVLREKAAHFHRNVSIEQYPQCGDLWRTPGLPPLAF
jgi:hypothetical protein